MLCSSRTNVQVGYREPTGHHHILPAALEVRAVEQYFGRASGKMVDASTYLFGRLCFVCLEELYW